MDLCKMAVVPTSLMPKGVEHNDPSASFTSANVAPTSLMPKGVEHLIGQATPRGTHFMQRR
jgi:hypothetical protein